MDLATIGHIPESERGDLIAAMVDAATAGVVAGDVEVPTTARRVLPAAVLAGVASSAGSKAVVGSTLCVRKISPAARTRTAITNAP